MKRFIAALLLLPLVPSAALAQSAPDPKAGQALWEGNQTGCKNCHGTMAEGAFGPDLAGRGLNAQQFSQAVRKPWGIMPAFVDSQVSDQDLANLAAWFATLPKREQPGPWRTEVPANAPLGQQIVVNMGCGQCHGATLNGPRTDLGAVNADFEYFRDLVYHHTDAMPKHQALKGEQGGGGRRLQMGNFSPTRLWEANLRQIYQWARDDIGFRPPIVAQLSAGAKDDKGVTYKLHVQNGGVKDRGITAEGLTISLLLPEGAKVVATTGAGYQGTKADAEAKGTVAVWQLAKSGPKDEQDYSVTLAGEGELRGMIRWQKAGAKTGSAEMINIAPPRAPGAGRGPGGPQ